MANVRIINYTVHNAVAKIWLFWFCEGRLCFGQNQMSQMRVGLKLFLKNVRWKKNKKRRVGQRVGLDDVLLLYSFYVFGHLSKWFTFFSFLVVCLLLLSGRSILAANGWVYEK
ncbi:MAG: hypothetical protein ABI207_00210 [Crocinitomicaceae bacterium]